ncbi:MAG: yidC [Clostridiales bacterium]|nr:yidC [Clostridiales bacterium]
MDFLIKPLTSFFDLISQAMVSITGSNNLGLAYFFAIFIFTAIIKLILLPLTITQTKSTAKMTEMQPKLKELQEKYKNDPKKLQEKQMALYKETGSNPMAGCLPLLLQFPIFIAMYQMLYKYPGFDQVPFFKLVASKIMTENGGIINGLLYLIVNHPFLFILPIISGATTFIQGIMMAPKGNDASAKTQKNMNTFMTLFIIYMGFTFPAAMVFYWIIQNVIQILTQYFIINKVKKNEEAKLVK